MSNSNGPEPAPSEKQPTEANLQSILAGMRRDQLAGLAAATKAFNPFKGRLRGLGVNVVWVTFDGCGDSVNDSAARFMASAPSDLDRLSAEQYGEAESAAEEFDSSVAASLGPDDKPIREAAIELGLAATEVNWDGWWNDDGGEGEVSVDLRTGKLTLDFRYFVQSMQEAPREEYDV
jgi:hypothetical protein